MLGSVLRRTRGIVLLQYVPNALGARGMNLRFCFWLRRLSAAGVDVRVMFHEPYFYYSVTRPWRNAAAAVQRVMARVLIQASSTVYLSTETWRRFLEPLATLRRSEVLPIPSSIPSGAPAEAIARFRSEFAADGAPLVGHFGTYGDHVGAELFKWLPTVVSAAPAARLVLIGARSTEFLERFRIGYPGIAARAHATGRLQGAVVSAALAACDLLVQPYPDGITTRRTSMMAGLKNGVPVVSTAGALTEGFWDHTGAVALVRPDDLASAATTVARLLSNPEERRELARRGEEMYARYFSMPQTIARLRGDAVAP